MNSPWIDPRKQPPTPGHILVVAENGERRCVIWSEGCSVSANRIKFWMPFPEVPKPDPFEEWFKANDYTVNPETTALAKRFSLRGWEAGVQWARSHPETDDAWTKAPGQRE